MDIVLPPRPLPPPLIRVESMDQHTRKRDLIYLTNAHFTKRGSTKDRRHVVFGVIPFTTVASLYGYTSSPGYCAPVAHRNTRKFAGEFHVREGGVGERGRRRGDMGAVGTFGGEVE